LGINFYTARAILKVFRKEGRIGKKNTRGKAATQIPNFIPAEPMLKSEILPSAMKDVQLPSIPSMTALPLFPMIHYQQQISNPASMMMPRMLPSAETVLGGARFSPFAMNTCPIGYVPFQFQPIMTPQLLFQLMQQMFYPQQGSK
jgi:hypothetical protein